MADKTNSKGSRAALRALARERVMTDIPTAAPFFGTGTNKAYELVAAGEWPTPIIYMGRKIRVPVAGIVAALGYSMDELIAAAPDDQDGAA